MIFSQNFYWLNKNVSLIIDLQIKRKQLIDNTIASQNRLNEAEKVQSNTQTQYGATIDNTTQAQRDYNSANEDLIKNSKELSVLFTKNNEEQITPEDLGLKRLKQSQIFGGKSIEESAKIFVSIIEGKGTEAQNTVVLANTAFALKTFDKNKTFETAFEEAKTSLLGLKAKGCLTKLVS